MYIILLILLIIITYIIVNKKNKPMVILWFSVLFALLFLFLYYVYFNYMTPKLNIIGEEIIEINVFDEYVDDGYEISNLKYKDSVVIKSNIDTGKIGIYNITYSLDYHGKKISCTRKVIVRDNINPIIELKGNSEINISQGVDYNEPGYIASDNYDGDITYKVEVINEVGDEVGVYELIYLVKDTSGNSYSIKRTVNRIKDNNGVIYLTFDDGPSSNTTKILDILKEQNIKATFFVVNYGSWYDDVVRRIVNEGHTIALHSYTHQYKLIYSSEDAYFDDLYKLRDRVKETTGIESNIIRFPGGSSNTISSFNKGIMTRIVKLVKEKGFHYFDWNVDSRDAGGAKNRDEVYNNVINNLMRNRNNVVLMHDLGSNNKTIEALPDIISNAKSKGYTFSKITYDTPMVVHGINN